MLVEQIIIREPFYYPQTGRWYQYTETFIGGELVSRVCKEVS